MHAPLDACHLTPAYIIVIYTSMDIERIVGFEWDAGNARKNEKHGVAQSEAEQVFFDQRLLVVADAGHSAGETRFMHWASRSTDGDCTSRSRYEWMEPESE